MFSFPSGVALRELGIKHSLERSLPLLARVHRLQFQRWSGEVGPFPGFACS